MMNNKTFADKAVQIAKNYKTNYFWGAFGWPTTNANIKRLLNQYPENYQYLSKADGSQFSFDCSGLVKAIIWGWNGSNDTYGGAKYGSNGLNDVNDEGLKAMCSDVSSSFSNIQIGSLLFTSGHVGIYVGNGMAVEATPSWNGGVQISAVANIGPVAGLPSRTWQCHGKFKLIDYFASNNSVLSSSQINYKQAIPARYFSKGYAGQYRVQPSIGVNARTGPGTNYSIIKALSCGSVVTNYGYYSVDSQNRIWLYVVIPGGNVAYICKDYLV